MPKQAPTLIELDAMESDVAPPAPTAAPDPVPAPVPAPKPGDPDYDWTQHYGDAELYVHTFSDGKVVAIKSMSAIYSKTWLYKTSQMKSNAQVEIMSLRRACCDEADDFLFSLDDTDGDPVEDLIRAWIKAGTVIAEGGEGLDSGN